MNSIQKAKETKERTAKLVSEFLEHAPLYAAKELDIGTKVSAYDSTIIVDMIGRNCRRCDRDTSWAKVKYERWVDDTHVCAYQCSFCQKEMRSFWFTVSAIDREDGPGSSGQILPKATRFRVKKLGESEMPVPKPSKAVERLLGDESSYYRKGLASLSEGFGVGAVAYFRRVIELRTDAMLDRIMAAAIEDGDQEAAASIAEAKRSTRTSDRLEQAAKALPQWLRPGGANPLGVLFGAYSEQLHASVDDETAVACAQDLRDAFEFVIVEIERHREAAMRFRKTITGTTGRQPPT